MITIKIEFKKNLQTSDAYLSINIFSESIDDFSEVDHFASSLLLWIY